MARFGIAQLQVQNADMVQGLHIVWMLAQNGHIGRLGAGKVARAVQGQSLTEGLVSQLGGQADHGVGLKRTLASQWVRLCPTHPPSSDTLVGMADNAHPMNRACGQFR